MRRSHLALGALLVVFFAARTASAQLGPYVMGDLSNQSWVGAEVGLATIDDANATVLDVDIALDVAIRPNLKIFGRLPLDHTSDDVRDGSSIGNATVGARWIWPPSGGSRLTWSAYASASLATASDSGDGGFSAATTSFTYFPHDPGWYAPNTTTLRGGGNLLLQTPGWFFQAELGLHLFLLDPGDDATLIKYGAAFGILVSQTLALVGELSGYTDLLDDETFGGGDDFVSALDLGARWQSGRLILGGRIYLPIDEDYRDLGVLGLGFDLHYLF